MPSLTQLLQYENKNAVVVGIANSGCDAAVELRSAKIDGNLIRISLIISVTFAKKPMWLCVEALGSSVGSVRTAFQWTTRSIEDTYG